MRRARGPLAALLVACSWAVGCSPPPAPRTPEVAAVPAEADFPSEPRATLLRYRSARFRLSVGLPDGRAWKIDDHRERALVARHEGTRSKLTVMTWLEPELVNRRRCQARAADIGLLSLRDPRTIEDEATVGPDAFDSRIWIAIESGATPGGPLVGHAVLVGGFLRKCLLVHYETVVARDRDEPVLTSRLAVARLRILGGIELQPFDEPVPGRRP